MVKKHGTDDRMEGSIDASKPVMDSKFEALRDSEEDKTRKTVGLGFTVQRDPTGR